MGNRLFIFGSFAHDPQGVLAAIGGLAFMVCQRIVYPLIGISRELGIAAFANAENRIPVAFNDSQFALRHGLV